MRILPGLLLLVATAVGVVAYVNAQDRSARTPARMDTERSTDRRRTSLVERLQGFRRAATENSSSRRGQPTPAPRPLSPQTPTESPTADALPAPTAIPTPAEPQTGPRPAFPVDDDPGLPSVLKRDTSPVIERVREPVSTPLTPSENSSSRRPDRSTTPPTFVRSQLDRRVLLRGEGPSLAVDATGPEAVVIGKEAGYAIRLSNQSDITAQNIYVQIGLPDWVYIVSIDSTAGAAQRTDDQSGTARLVWNVDSLAGRAQEQLILKIVPRDNRPFDLAVEWTTRPVSSYANVQVLQPMLQMTLDGPKNILFGATQVYTITLSNPGTGDAENVIVDLAPGQIGSEPRQIGTIEAGQEKQIEVELTARQAGMVEIRAVAAADGDLQAEIAERIEVRRAKLEMEMVGPPLKFAGTVAQYTLQIANTGNAVAENVVSAIVLPSGVNYLAGIEGGNVLGRAINWNLGNLEPGTEQTFKIQCELTSSGEMRLQARSQAEGGLDATAIASTQVEALADLKLVVNDPKGPQQVGQEVIYELSVINRGTKAAENINVLAQFSEGVEPVKADGWRAEVVPGQVLFHPISRLDPGQQVTLKVVAEASRDGNHRFRAEVKCGDPETRLVSEDTTRFFGDSLPTRNARQTDALPFGR